MSTPFLQFNWQSTDCVGAPSSIFAYNNYLNSTILSIIDGDTGYDTCSTQILYVPPDSCCRSSVDTAITQTYQSMAGTFIYQGDAYDSLSSQGLVPTTAVNNQYCTINSLGAGFVEYTTGYYLSMGECFQDFVKCKAGTLFVYPEPSCSGNPEEYSLLVESNYTSAIIGNFTGKMTTFTTGEFSYVWTMYFPTYMVYPLNKDPTEAFGTFCVIFAAILPLGSFFLKVYQLYKRWSLRDLWMMFVNIIYFLFAILLLNTEYYIVPTTVDVSKLSLITTIPIYFMQLSLLSVYLLDVYILFNLCFQTKKIYKVMSYVGVSLIHFALDGNAYLYYWSIYGLYTGDPSIYTLQENWGKITKSARLLIWFLFGVFTTLAVTIKIVFIDTRFKKANLYGKIFLLFRNIEISLPLMLHLLNVMFYYIVWNIATFTFIARNDRAAAGLNNCTYLCYVFHFMIHQYSFYTFKPILLNALKYKNEIPTAKPGEKSEAPVKMLIAETVFIRITHEQSLSGGTCKKPLSSKWDWDLIVIRAVAQPCELMTIQQENIHNLMQVLHLQSNEDAYIMQNSPQMLLQSLVYDDCTNEDLYEMYLSEMYLSDNTPPLPQPSVKPLIKPKPIQLSQVTKLKQEIVPHSASSFHFPSPPAYSPHIEPLIPPRRSSKAGNDIRHAIIQKPPKNKQRIQANSLIEQRIANEHHLQRKAVSELSRKAITQMDSIQENQEVSFKYSKRAAASLIEKRPKQDLPSRNASSLIDKQNSSVLAMLEMMQQEAKKKLTVQTKLDNYHSTNRKQASNSFESTTPHSKSLPLSHKFIPLYHSPSKANPEYSAFLQDISKTRKSSLSTLQRPKLSNYTEIPPVNLIHHNSPPKTGNKKAVDKDLELKIEDSIKRITSLKGPNFLNEQEMGKFENLIKSSSDLSLKSNGIESLSSEGSNKLDTAFSPSRFFEDDIKGSGLNIKVLESDFLQAAMEGNFVIPKRKSSANINSAGSTLHNLHYEPPVPPLDEKLNQGFKAVVHSKESEGFKAVVHSKENQGFKA
ncbi:hypothetical protein HDV06_007016, partial [Boothiomyces sp. JEL0866]